MLWADLATVESLVLLVLLDLLAPLVPQVLLVLPELVVRRVGLDTRETEA